VAITGLTNWWDTPTTPLAGKANKTGDTFTGPVTVESIVAVGKAGTQNAQLKYVDDSGADKYRVGINGGIGSKAFFVFDVVHNVEKIGVDGSIALGRVNLNGRPADTLPWNNISAFTNGFSNGTIAGLPPVAYRLEGSTVRFRGELRFGTPDSVAFTLPVEARPNNKQYLHKLSFGIGILLIIQTNGDVEVLRDAFVAAVTLDGLTFPID
jgi:hypothetical protein